MQTEFAFCEELWRRDTCIHLIGINSMYAWAKRKIVCYEVHLWSFFKGAEGSTASLLKVAWAKNCLVWGASLKPLIQGRGRQNNLGFCYLGFCFGFCYILGELKTDFFFCVLLEWFPLLLLRVLLPVTTMNILYYPYSLFCLIHMPQNI
jgi:hypothetical protein